ncbi:hypothetical protein [Acuticoccus sp. I52.16.1]|uniref:hypothetical protein n=1 Tax=Acuticoccus sp. I52.16.1 TaxID=2928472 RepID=UPI001FD43418|nr:hypothetical protein [Acuticoccus sp. I52.16.1]UOM35068.1 hypothetical protein MRB58_02315 [Acuticoccus sp. I52.16.1]
MNRIAALDAGTYYHHRTLYEDRYRTAFDEIIYAPRLDEADLSALDVLIVSCRTDPAVLVPQRRTIADFLAAGGTVVAMGSTGPHQWLPGVVWHDTETNFWWWKEGGSLGLAIAAPDHPLFRAISLDDATWHYHGYFEPPAGAVPLISAEGRGPILYEDRVTTAGAMIVTSLDPMYHHGSHFMPATTRFLDGFLPFLRTYEGRTRRA